ncbi:HD-GYP domain-containing protein [Burkholderiaceae bacterium DAT-1]|nr:HD-GYP domain-containing protein [Burkholderiaceae bacterium DAT-1]
MRLQQLFGSLFSSGETQPAQQHPGNPQPGAHVEDLLRSLYVMATVVEARDPYTGGHLWRVSRFSRQLAEAGGLPAADIARITLGGFLHDLGKVGIPDAVLNKPDKLTDEEYAIIKTHPQVGERLLAEHPLSRLAHAAVVAHHETPDGRGYPNGLSGDAIPVDARIVGVCDAFDAMTSNRPYRRGMPVERALSIIQDNLGRQFDQTWGHLFVEQGRAGAFDHVVGHSDTGMAVQACPSCGPTIVVKRSQRTGDTTYCRCCGAQVRIHANGSDITIEPTGQAGTADQLQADVDMALIDGLVSESIKALRIE